jgi:hypothetical protein
VTTPAFAFIDEQHCEIAYGVGNCFQATDGNWYAKSALVVAIAPTNAPGLDLNPISLVQSALNDLTGPISTVEKWILKQLVKLGSLIGNDITKVYSYLGSRLGGVENTISQLAGQVNALADRAGKDLSGDVGKLSKDAEGWVADAEHYADSAVKAFERDVLDPALRDLRTAISDAEKVSKAALSTFERDVVKPIEHDASEALHDAKKAVSFIDHSALDAVHLIDECWDWLLWVAKNPAKAIEELPSKMLGSLTSAQLESQGATITSGWSGLADDLDKKFPDG